MKKILFAVLLLIASSALAQFNPTFDTIKFKRGGKLYQLITYGDDSIRINGTTFRASGLWATIGSYIQPSPTKAIKYPGIPTTIGKTVPGTYRTTYYDKSTKALLMFEPNGGGGVITDGQILTGGGGMTYTYETEKSDAAISIDSIHNISGEIVIKNATTSSIVGVRSVEGLLFDGDSAIYIPQGRYVTITADSNRFITTGNTPTIEITNIDHRSTSTFTLEIDNNTIIWEGTDDNEQDTLQLPSPETQIGIKYLIIKSGRDSAIILPYPGTDILCSGGVISASSLTIKENHSCNLEFQSDGTSWYLIREEDYITPAPEY